jgi:hypothetical protein
VVSVRGEPANSRVDHATLDADSTISIFCSNCIVTSTPHMVQNTCTRACAASMTLSPVVFIHEVLFSYDIDDITGVVVFVVLKYCPTNHQLPRCGCKCRVTCTSYCPCYCDDFCGSRFEFERLNVCCCLVLIVLKRTRSKQYRSFCFCSKWIVFAC